MASKELSHPSFELINSQAIESLNLQVQAFRHKKTGALHYHLAADNPENVFFVALRTVPTDSTGVAHVLEHTALCGSQRYPVRDPFFMMIRRSLNTFMNAFTSSDWTAYPFASQNKKDFNNLLDVYLDAVFFSRLDPLDFAQEGHRLEFATPDDVNSELTFKGVVFNEMKGSMSSPVNYLWHSLCRYLYPTTTYHYNSGGEPEHIPDLTHEQLTAFYHLHYHPSNALFFTYGDIPAKEHQAKFENQVLSDFDKLDREIRVEDEKKYFAPVNVVEHYAFDDGGNVDGKTHIVLAWLLGHSTDLKELMKAKFLSNVLLLDSASPLLKALETSDLGSAPSPLCGLEDSHHEMAFVCGIEGSDPKNAEALERLVLDVLHDVAEKGIPLERQQAILHQLELNQREVSGGSYPYGLQLIMSCLGGAIHRGDPIALLDIDPVIEYLNEAIKDENFIKNLVNDLLMNNAHRVRLVLQPDTKFSTRQQAAEKARLQKIKDHLSDTEKQSIVQLTKQLTERQNQQEDLEILPKVTIQDIPTEMKIPEVTEQLNSDPISFYAQGTNGLIYQDIIADMPELTSELEAAMPYYTCCLAELGCGERGYLQMQTWQTQVSGGVSASSLIRPLIDDTQQLAGHITIGSKGLQRYHQDVGELLQETFSNVRFNEYTRIKELISQSRMQQNQAITRNGSQFAMSAAASGISPGAALGHRLYGLAGIQTINELDDSFQDESAIESFAEKLKQIHQLVLSAPRQYLLIAEAQHQATLLQTMSEHLPTSTEQPFSAFSLPKVSQQIKQLWTVNTQVNFCAKAYPTVAVEHPDSAALSVLSVFLRNGFLHRVIREQGGAYGGGASHDSDNGAFRFYSYRDPRLQETLDDFDAAIDWLLSNKHEPRQLEEAILGVIGQIDKPSSPAGEAKRAFYNQLHQRSKEQRQAARQRILAVTLDDLHRVTEQYLRKEVESIAVITNAAMAGKVADKALEVHKI